MNKYFLILIISLLDQPSYSKVWILADKNLEISFNDEDLSLRVKDKRCNKIWEQTTTNKQLVLKKTTQKGNTINLSFSGKTSFNATFILTATSALEVSINAPKNMQMEELSFPAAFKTPDKNHSLLYTDGEGFLLPADDTEYPIGRNNMYSMTGLAMPWMGITDTDFKTGYMAILETPNDSEINVVRDNGLITFEPVWLSQKGSFGYNRKVIYHFFDKGGYVAQCKKYREYVWGKNGASITLKEKEKQFPAIAKMVGAPHIYLWDDARQVSFAKEMKSAGIEKAFVLWNPNHLPYPEADYDTKIKDLGYLSGVYELFRDAKLRDTVGTINKTDTTGKWLNRFSFPGLFNKITLKQKDGSLHYSGFGYDINPKTIVPLIPELRTDRELKFYPHEAFFLDGFLASGIYEDYGKENPLTRTQYKNAVVDMNKLFTEQYKLMVGMEWGADYGVPKTSFAHGITTLHRMLYKSKDRRKKGSIYYDGDWGNPSRPSIMVGEYTADKNYMKWAINEKIRVPLYQLVYHDAIVTTWRWDDANHHMPAIWWKKDLFNMLYGTAPVWTLDKPRWDKFKETFVESYQTICPWLQQIAYDEMVSHRFVNEDHTVQESTFSSGKKVVVNFGDQAYKHNDLVIEPRGFAISSNDK